MVIVGGLNRGDAVYRAGKLADGSPASAVHLISCPPDTSPQNAYIGPAPHAFMVEQAPRSVLQPHFHFHRQFQVVVGGAGELGRHHLSVGSVHYAAAETAYGPLRAGEDGLRYMTLRQVTEVGAQYLPAQLEKLQRGIKRRQCNGDSLPPPATADRQVTRPLIPCDDTGLAAWLLDVPASGPVPHPDTHGARDRYCVIMNGSVFLSGESLPELSVIWIGRNERSPSLIAGDRGLRLIVVQFPTSS